MESIQTVVRNLAIILLLASFLEMLLPSQSMKGFVKLVMGLFVISAILTPITTLLGMTMETGIPAWTENAAQEMPVLASGEEGEVIGMNAVQEQYKAIIINQIIALRVGMEEIKDIQVNVELTAGTGGLTDIPRIGQVFIHIFHEERGVQPIEEVVIETNEPKSDREPMLSGVAQEFRAKVAAFMQIPIEQIHVTEE
ncbi:Stage III sporulation protein AF (Spore_III_AF) [Desulfitobacterium dichloroeliminans LMG P-21439]|uniref:Stage III sporulation protein AF (Spore_III_AF) n=1 Tax=Desulfitobacterium dichloroeliminans (strain LMG P-21439 / DCA1) TaxID=871963 RepID=L0FA03_DESDL|nr:stage III sporulation protein AF [Desulfitobacterium dichloroeliminans]AGA69860.1 Stage III sporulation protein AF (Spore_III_AF) [Desulfitobacterium dichloroeliminans LMG P-21439]